MKKPKPKKMGTMTSLADEPIISTLEAEQGAVADFIEKLDQATEPSRELDAQIYCATHKSAFADETPEQHLAYARRCCPHYTSSIDDALRLLRNHYFWQLKQGIVQCTAIVWWLESDWDDTGAPTGYSTTYPALALARAVILARAVEDRKVRLPSKDSRLLKIGRTDEARG